MIGHLIRHSEWSKVIIEGKVEGRRTRAKPRITYLDEIKKGRKYYEIKRLAKQRNGNLMAEENMMMMNLVFI